MPKTANPVLRKLKTSQILKLTVNIVLGLLNLEAKPNSTYSGKDLIYHILSACISQTSISQVSEFNDEAPSEGAIRSRLEGLDLEEVQRKINVMLKKRIIRTLPRNSLKFAIDFNEIPFYGTETAEGDTRKSRAKKGTTRFFVYATIYVILRNKRYTLAVKYVRKGEKLTDVIDFLLEEAKDMGLRIQCLFLDREFYNIDVINHLKDEEVPFIVPCVRRGRSGGIRKLFVGKKSYSTEYTMRSGGKEATFPAHVVVKYSKGKYKRRGAKYFAYAVYGMDISVNRTFNEYRKRFGIESSYKLKNLALPRTSTKNPMLRLLYVGLAFLLVNVWIYVQWMFLSERRRGGRQPVYWPFKTMLRQMLRILEDLLGFIDDMPLASSAQG
ncbi:MAG: ISH3 family transposase [Candidatus Hydrothermarchaeaceae archaeon]